MGKIAPVSAKYIIHAKIEVEGVVEKPDVIGAVFGQTEGLLGSDLELRDLQKSGRVGRIDAELKTTGGKTKGVIYIPSSLNKTETALIAAALETIQRIGPCDSKVEIDKIEDARLTKRDYLMQRAKDLLKTMIESEMPDSHEITEKIQTSVKEMGMIKYGPEKLTAGPDIIESDEIIVVEGRADVVNLLHNNINNAISLNGTSVPKSVAKLCKEKTVTAFVDGDRGGDLIIKELLQRTKIDFVAIAPTGREVEELTQKEMIKALRQKVPIEEYKKGSKQPKTRRKKTRSDKKEQTKKRRPTRRDRRPSRRQRPTRDRRGRSRSRQATSSDLKSKFKKMLEELVGTRGAYILNKELDILGKVPVAELPKTLKDLEGVFAIVMDGTATKQLVIEAEKANISFMVAPKRETRSRKTKILDLKDL